MLNVLPFHMPDVGQEEIDAVVKVLKSGWLTTGVRPSSSRTSLLPWSELAMPSRSIRAQQRCISRLRPAVCARGMKSSSPP